MQNDEKLCVTIAKCPLYCPEVFLDVMLLSVALIFYREYQCITVMQLVNVIPILSINSAIKFIKILIRK